MRAAGSCAVKANRDVIGNTEPSLQTPLYPDMSALAIFNHMLTVRRVNISRLCCRCVRWRRGCD